MNQFGSALREVRVRKGMSLRAVAIAADISPSLLSQVETGKTLPSVGTLYALVNVLGTSVDALLGVPAAGPVTSSAAKGATSPVQRAQDNLSISMEHGVVWERLAVDASGSVDALRATYLPGASSSAEGKYMRHAGFEYGYLVEGELTLRLEFDTYLLRAGDSVCFDSMRPHLYENQGSDVARGVWHVVVAESPQPRSGGFHVQWE